VLTIHCFKLFKGDKFALSAVEVFNLGFFSDEEDFYGFSVEFDDIAAFEGKWFEENGDAVEFFAGHFVDGVHAGAYFEGSKEGFLEFSPKVLQVVLVVHVEVNAIGNGFFFDNDCAPVCFNARVNPCDEFFGSFAYLEDAFEIAAGCGFHFIYDKTKPF